MHVCGLTDEDSLEQEYDEVEAAVHAPRHVARQGVRVVVDESKEGGHAEEDSGKDGTDDACRGAGRARGWGGVGEQGTRGSWAL